MKTTFIKWEKQDFGQAMINAIRSHTDANSIKYAGDKLTFNGFWRNGKKRNVCIWPSEATWCDLNISDSNNLPNKGGIKTFAKTIFNLDLPEFMNQYGNTVNNFIIPKKELKTFSTDYVNRIWTSLLKKDVNRENKCLNWILNNRRMPYAKELLKYGFANLYEDDINFFDNEHKQFISQRLKLGHNIIVPIRSIESNQVENLFFRCLNNIDKSNKTRLMPNCGGFSNENNLPRSFGYPNAILDFDFLILCEGMADYFATECLLDASERYIPIGVPGVAAFNKWVTWLCNVNYKGQIIILYQLDLDAKGLLNKLGTGQISATNSKKELIKNGLSAHLFNWSYFLKSFSSLNKQPFDIADIFLSTNDSYQNLFKNFHAALQISVGGNNGVF